MSLNGKQLLDPLKVAEIQDKFYWRQNVNDPDELGRTQFAMYLAYLN